MILRELPIDQCGCTEAELGANVWEGDQETNHDWTDAHLAGRLIGNSTGFGIGDQQMVFESDVVKLSKREEARREAENRESRKSRIKTTRQHPKVRKA
eukprot:scaffold1944_cov241-Pinguiococcus_pyrenoidosus.AAC.15